MKLWYVPSGRREEPREVVVAKVGRKWADVGDGLRIDVETWRADGGRYASPGRCFISRERYEDWSLANDYARVLEGILRAPLADDVSSDDVLLAALRLKVARGTVALAKAMFDKAVRT